MSEDHLQFLKNKFIADFQEAMEEFGEILLPLRLYFDEVLKVLEEWRISPSTPIRMKDFLYDLRYVLADCVMFAEKERDHKAENKKSLFNAGHDVMKCLFLCKTRRKLLRIKKNLLRGMNDAAGRVEPENFSPSDLVNVSWAPDDFLPFDASEIHGFDDHFHKMKALLLESSPSDDGGNIKAIGIVGMAGSGKSTLARMLFNSSSVKQTFYSMIWVNLHHKFNPEDEDSRNLLLAKIFQGYSWQRKLHNHLQNQKYLIVLDNVWHESDWYSELNSHLQIDSTNNLTRLIQSLSKKSGGAIIVTSRLEGVASRMVGEHNLHRMEPLLDADACLSIFMDTINRKDFVTTSNSYPTLLNMKKEIGDQCDGLPLAAKTLAEIISIEIAKKETWSDPTRFKAVAFRLDVYDSESKRKACDIISNFPGVKKISFPGVEDIFPGNTDDHKEFRSWGAFDVLVMTRELEKSWHTELILVVT